MEADQAVQGARVTLAEDHATYHLHFPAGTNGVLVAPVRGSPATWHVRVYPRLETIVADLRDLRLTDAPAVGWNPVPTTPPNPADRGFHRPRESAEPEPVDLDADLAARAIDEARERVNRGRAGPGGAETFRSSSAEPNFSALDRSFSVHESAGIRRLRARATNADNRLANRRNQLIDAAEGLAAARSVVEAREEDVREHELKVRQAEAEAAEANGRLEAALEGRRFVRPAPAAAPAPAPPAEEAVRHLDM